MNTPQKVNADADADADAVARTWPTNKSTHTLERGTSTKEAFCVACAVAKIESERGLCLGAWRAPESPQLRKIFSAWKQRFAGSCAPREVLGVLSEAVRSHGAEPQPCAKRSEFHVGTVVRRHRQGPHGRRYMVRALRSQVCGLRTATHERPKDDVLWYLVCG